MTHEKAQSASGASTRVYLQVGLMFSNQLTLRFTMTSTGLEGPEVSR